jgi:hypothetical protein
MKCDILLDRKTLAQPAEHRSAWLMPQKKQVSMEVRDGRLHLGDLSVPIHSIRSVRSTGSPIHVSILGDLLTFETVEIQYETEAGTALERDQSGVWKRFGTLTIGVIDVGFLIRQIEDHSLPLVSSASSAGAISEPTRVVKETNATLGMKGHDAATQSGELAGIKAENASLQHPITKVVGRLNEAEQRLETEWSQVQQGFKFCTHCARRLSPHAKFCDACGKVQA